MDRLPRIFLTRLANTLATHAKVYINSSYCMSTITQYIKLV